MTAMSAPTEEIGCTPPAVRMIAVDADILDTLLLASMEMMLMMATVLARLSIKNMRSTS